MKYKRMLSTGERTIIEKTLEALIVRDPKTGNPKWVQKGWTEELLAERLSKKYDVKPPLTTFNIRAVRRAMFGMRYNQKPALPNVVVPTEIKVPTLPPLPIVRAAEPAPKQENNFFKSVSARLADLEQRVTELEETITQPQAKPVQLDLPLIGEDE